MVTLSPLTPTIDESGTGATKSRLSSSVAFGNRLSGRVTWAIVCRSLDRTEKETFAVASLATGSMTENGIGLTRRGGWGGRAISWKFGP